MNGDEYNRIRTVRRAFTLTKIAFAGGNGTWRLISEIGSDDNESTYSTHKTDGTSDNVRKSLNDLDDWFKAAYQFVISILIFFKRMSFFLKQLENSVGGVTGSECVCEGILGQIFPNLLGVVIKGIDDKSEAGSGCGCHCRGPRGYFETGDWEIVVTAGEGKAGCRLRNSDVGAVWLSAGLPFVSCY